MRHACRPQHFLLLLLLILLRRRLGQHRGRLCRQRRCVSNSIRHKTVVAAIAAFPTALDRVSCSCVMRQRVVGDNRSRRGEPLTRPGSCSHRRRMTHTHVSKVSRMLRVASLVMTRRTVATRTTLHVVMNSRLLVHAACTRWRCTVRLEWGGGGGGGGAGGVVDCVTHGCGCARWEWGERAGKHGTRSGALGTGECGGGTNGPCLAAGITASTTLTCDRLSALCTYSMCISIITITVAISKSCGTTSIAIISISAISCRSAAILATIGIRVTQRRDGTCLW